MLPSSRSALGEWASGRNPGRPAWLSAPSAFKQIGNSSCAFLHSNRPRRVIT
jgi:hypothetical protein